MTADVTYAPDRIGYRYGVADDNYQKGYHRGQDVRQKGPRGGSVVTQVDAIDDGVVVYVGRPNSLLGATVVIDTGRAEGRFESHSHMADVCVSVGDRVTSGQRLGRNADMDESPGFIDGPHDHCTITDRLDGAWMTWVGEYDPLPFMQAAYARAVEGAAASDSARPFRLKNLTQGVTLMPNISIVFNLDTPDPKEQMAVGPRGRVSLTPQTADLLARWMQWQIADGKTIAAGGMTIEEMDLLIREVLKKIS
ncbi:MULTISPECIES: M23 family metallopeptidase [unclassified Microbacterium]|uniref:M23 family metallopeptidase n=1 Tax=unclassified Microbacterium TaxID=2609290 RepID=UPI00301827D9